MLTLRCTLLRDTFEGSLPDDPRRAEWPPSWMRLYSALVAVANPGPDDGLLRTLETAGDPHIKAAEALMAPTRMAYVPTNHVFRNPEDAGHGTLVGRTSGEREWARAVPSSPDVWYRWPRLDLSPQERERLGEVCRRVPYLGRSTSPVIAELTDDEPMTGTWLIPDPVGRRGWTHVATLRSPFPGALDALREAYEQRMRGGSGDPWAIGIGVDYWTEGATGDEQSISDGPYGTLVLFALESAPLDGRHAARVATAIRRALLARAPRPIPALHGHHDGDVVQAAVLPLPFVDHPHADGHLLGVALAIPELDRGDLAAFAAALPPPGETVEVTAGPLGVLRLRRLSPLDAARSGWGLRPQRWTRPSKAWVTALPMVFDRFFKRDMDIEAEVVRAVRNSRLPEPARVFVSRTPLLRGALDLAPSDTIRREGDTAIRPYRHVALRFDERVRGPVVIGSMRHYGLGLCVPVEEA
jgi:CRISPR-associated protein Csb2